MFNTTTKQIDLSLFATDNDAIDNVIVPHNGFISFFTVDNYRIAVNISKKDNIEMTVYDDKGHCFNEKCAVQSTDEMRLRAKEFILHRKLESIVYGDLEIDELPEQVTISIDSHTSINDTIDSLKHALLHSNQVIFNTIDDYCLKIMGDDDEIMELNLLQNEQDIWNVEINSLDAAILLIKGFAMTYTIISISYDMPEP